jgi:hypothetical protein
VTLRASSPLIRGARVTSIVRFLGASSASTEARDHRDIYCVALGDRCQRFSGVAPLDGLFALIVRELRLPAELNARGLSALPAFTGSLADQVPLAQTGGCCCPLRLGSGGLL